MEKKTLKTLSVETKQPGHLHDFWAISLYSKTNETIKEIILI